MEEWVDDDLEMISERITIHTLEGNMRADVGDWIIRGVKGEFYSCKPDIFVDSYTQDVGESHTLLCPGCKTPEFYFAKGRQPMADDGSVVRAKLYYTSSDEGYDKQNRARKHVVRYYNQNIGLVPGGLTFDLEDTYVVLFTHVLGSWKALVSTIFPDGRYYEVTYNSDKKETYVDEYKKQNCSFYKEEGS